MKIKKNLPWQIKVTVKLLLGLLHANYRFLKLLRLVEHGKMEDPVFAITVFENKMRIAIERFPQLTLSPLNMFCELGPGDSILSGVIAALHGFTGSTLIDVGNFENTGTNAIRQVFEKYGRQQEIEAVADENLKQFIKDKYNIAYYSNGSEAYQLLENEQFSFSYSNTVLQHIAKKDVAQTFEQIFKAHKPGSISVHSINFLDHFSGGFRNRKIPERIWESGLIKRSNLYTNRLGLSELLTIASSVGFKSYVHSYELLGESTIVMPIESNSQPEPALFSGKRIIRATIYLLKQ